MEDKKIVQALEDENLDKVAGGASDLRGKWICENCHAIWDTRCYKECPWCHGPLVQIQ